MRTRVLSQRRICSRLAVPCPDGWARLPLRPRRSPPPMTEYKAFTRVMMAEREAVLCSAIAHAALKSGPSECVAAAQLFPAPPWDRARRLRD